MARTTISLPDELKAEMDKVAEQANWSEIAASAFLAEIQRIKIRNQRTEGKKMNAAIERLKKSKADYAKEASDRGHADGVRWAQHKAEYGELKRLSENWEQSETTETEDALGAPGVFGRMISNDEFGRLSINDFWTNNGSDESGDQYSFEYWDGFVEGALEVFDQVEE